MSIATIERGSRSPSGERRKDPDAPHRHVQLTTDFFNSLRKQPEEDNVINDPVMRNFYSALIEPGQEAFRAEFAGFMHNVYKKRPLTPSASVNLIFRAFQSYVRNNEFTSAFYPQKWGENDWDGVLSFFRRNKEMQKYIFDIMTERSTPTNEYQRYIGVKAIINHHFGANHNNDLIVADFGCSANEGLVGFEYNTPFSPVQEEGTKGFVTEYSDKQMLLGSAVGIDQADPYTEDAIRWRIDCLYPRELANGKKEDIESFYPRAQQAMRVFFEKGDARSLPNRTEGTFDAVIISTMLYQLFPEERQRVLREALRVTSVDGVVLVNDFAQLKGQKNKISDLEFFDKWPKWGYRTFMIKKDSGTVQELLQFETGRCKSVRPGRDFDNYLKASSAA